VNDVAVAIPSLTTPSFVFPAIKYNEIIVDNCCMQLVSRPEQFDVMVRIAVRNLLVLQLL
jgi:isocitrate/isopropylmalate dehydrogenase